MQFISSNLIIVYTGDETYSAYDYFPTEPGTYILFSVSDKDLKNCKVEMTFQYTNLDFLTTLTQVGDVGGYWRNSVIGGRESENKLLYFSGCPVGNQANLFMLFAIPINFKDGDTWDSFSIPLYEVTWINDRTVGSIVYDDCIKISFQSSDGNGEFYLAKGIGIIEYIFTRWDDSVFSAQIIEYGKLEPSTISGTLTLDGKCPAEGYGVCLSNCGELGVNIALVDSQGHYSLEMFGHSIVLRYGPIREDGRLYHDAKVEQKFDDISGDIVGLELSMGLPPQPVVAKIDDVFVSDQRCNFGSHQEVGFHCSYSCGFVDASGITVVVDDTNYVTNYTGWITLSAFSENIEKKIWEITNVLDCDSYEVHVDNPFIIWDKIEIIIYEHQRVDLGEEFEWTGRYIYDSEPFQGSLVLNDTLTKNVVGKYGYKVMGISDQKYGLTSFTANDFEVIFDRVNIEVTVSDNRIDVSEEPDITVSAQNEYDSTPFQGNINFVQPLSHTDIGKHEIKVESINDPLFGLTTFTQNEVKCIWDRIKIVGGGVSQESTIVKNSETVWFKAEYEYDSEIFDGSKGVLYVNGEPLEWSSATSRWEKEYVSDKPQTISFEVTGVQDERYGLSTFDDMVGSLSIQWKQQGIPGFPHESIILGIMVGILLLWWLKKRI